MRLGLIDAPVGDSVLIFVKLKRQIFLANTLPDQDFFDSVELLTHQAKCTKCKYVVHL